MSGMWNFADVRYSGCGMFRMWHVWDVECWECGIFGMWDVPDVGCLGYAMFEICNALDLGCSECGMFGMLNVDVGICGDVECWFTKCHHLLLSGADPGRLCEFSMVGRQRKILILDELKQS